MLDEGAELGVGALGAVIRSEGDDEARHIAEPVDHLLLLPGLLPPASSKHHSLGLAYHGSTLLLEAGRRPQEAQRRVDQVCMVRIVQLATLTEDRYLHPFTHLGRRLKPGAEHR
ncbi:hypothetical protein D9M71_671400 [compost metagenome]